MSLNKKSYLPIIRPKLSKDFNLLKWSGNFKSPSPVICRHLQSKLGILEATKIYFETLNNRLFSDKSLFKPLVKLMNPLSVTSDGLEISIPKINKKYQLRSKIQSQRFKIVPSLESLSNFFQVFRIIPAWTIHYFDNSKNSLHMQS